MNNLPLLIYLSSVVLISGNHLTCPTNEVIPDCVPCRQTCADPVDKICTLECRKPTTCYCRSGWLRNAYGVCIPEHQCPGHRCPKNEEVPECKRCNERCSEQDKICPLICIPGDRCQCKVGCFRNRVGVCVSPGNCFSK